MGTRQITLIGTLTGLGVLLLASLAVIYATRAQTVYAQDPPELSLSVSMGEVSLPQGGSTYLAASAHNLPRDPNNQYELLELTYRKDLFRVLSDESTENANECANGMGDIYTVNRVYANPKNFGGGLNNFTITSSCPAGSYRVRISVKHKDASTDLVFGTKDFTVIPGPSVTVALSSASFYRGTSSDVTMGFSYLNNLQDGSDLSYRADIMRIISENSLGYADKCEGAGLGNIDKSDDSDSHLSNPVDSPSGAIEDQDGDGTVEVSGQIPTTCPTGRYKLTVELWDSSNSALTSTSIEFVVSTDPNATPSVTIALDLPSPVAPGTEIEATITFYDLQGDSNTSLDYLAEVTKTVNSEEVDANECGGTWIGEEIGTGVSGNPMVYGAKIVAACPAGAYTLKASMSDSSHNELVSGAVDFIIGNPDLMPTLPTITGYTGKVGNEFSEVLPAGSGGDGTLGYAVTVKPAWLSFTEGTRTIAGTPTAAGSPSLTYTVRDVEGPVWIYQDLTTLVGSLAGVKRFAQWEIALLPAFVNEGDRPLAITQPILMNVRSGPGLDHDVVTTVPQGTRATIIGIGPLDDWYQVELDTLSTPAWIYQDLTTLVGSLAGVPRFTTLQTALLPVIAPVDDRPLAIIQPILMNVRSGPGLDYDVVTTVAQGTRATIIGIGPLDDWYQVELDTLSTPAWIYQDLTTLVGSLAGVPRFTTLQTALLPVIEIVDDRPLAITQPPILNVREGPGTEYDVVFTVPQGTRAAIVGIGPLNEWYLVELDGLFGLDNRLAWIYQDLTILEGALVGVRQITAEEIALLPVAITQPEIMNARQGPGTEYEVSLVVPKGTWARITGIDAQNEWYLVEIDGLDSPTWIYRVLTNLVGSLAGVSQRRRRRVFATCDHANDDRATGGNNAAGADTAAEFDHR